MSIGKINNLVSSVSHFLTENEKISVPIMAARVRKALQEFPEDQTITSMAQVLTRMADNKLLITKSEFKKLAQGFYTRNTRFNEIFASELGNTELKAPKYYNHDGSNYSVDGGLQLDQFADPILANALQNAFDKNTALKMYSDKAALESVRKVSKIFMNYGLECRANVATGNPDVLIVEATFETPKGQTSVFVPVEVNDNKVLEPSVFVSNRGSEEINSSNIVDYVKSYAGNKIKTSSNKVISNVELAVTKFKAANQVNNEFFVNSITGLNVNNETPNVSDVNLPEVKDTEIESFAKKFDSPLGIASFTFGERKVATARRSIETSLRNCGIKNAQLSMFDCNQDSITFAVNVGKTAFSIPVKMNTASPTADIFICNGKVRELNKSNVESVMVKQEVDYKSAAISSPLYNIKPSELVETVKTAMLEQNLAKAEDALNVLASSSDYKAYNFAMSVYLDSLGKQGLQKEAKAESCCNRIIKSASSKFPVCGHTGLPTHKVYQDQYGDCHPMYRKGMEQSNEGTALIMNSKIFL